MISVTKKLQPILSSDCRNKKYDVENFDETVRKSLLTYERIWKIATGQVDDCTTADDNNSFKKTASTWC